MANTRVSFEADAIGSVPKGWTATRTGAGEAKWTVERDETALSGSKIVKQSGVATFPLLLNRDSRIKRLFEVDDATFAGPGMVGLWTKADSMTLFDQIAFGSTD